MLVMKLDIPEKTAGVEIDQTAPVIVGEVTPAEPVQVQSVSSVPLDDKNLQIDSGEPDFLPEESGDISAADKEDAVVTKSENVAQDLVTEFQEKIERRKVELEDMKSMLVILEERNDDPERIELYKELIAKTEQEILDLQDDIVRYNKVAKG